MLLLLILVGVLLLKVQKLNNSNEELTRKLTTISETIVKIEEYTSYANEVSAQLASDQAKIQSTLTKVSSNVYKLKVENEQVKSYLAGLIPPDLVRMYNETRTGK